MVVMMRRKKIVVGLGSFVMLFAAALLYILPAPPARSITFPDGKRFAFSIVDDTDMATTERDKPLYDILHQYGMRTTKTIWVLKARSDEHSPDSGDTLQDPAYREFVADIRRKGFEIALHGVRGGSSERADIIQGLDEFRNEYGQYPVMHVNHSLNADNLYWGSNRWSFAPYRWAYGMIGENRFSGEDPQSKHFWGDLVQERVKYVNQFTFSDINLLNVTHSFPYHLSEKPYVNFWFPTSDGDNLDLFEALLSPENLDRLEREGGVCLVYTHLGAGSFTKSAEATARFEARIKDVAARNGWFAPASEILDHLAKQPGWTREPSFREKVRLETLFLWTLVTR
jgi:hypothetical protein